MMTDYDTISDFIEESNKIEGIFTEVSLTDIQVFTNFLEAPELNIDMLEKFVAHFQPNARLRNIPGYYDVKVGGYYPPKGGYMLEAQLKALLVDINDSEGTPHSNHVEYEKLHPFTDCNGRSGRAIWAWDMLNRGFSIRLGFLHKFYYQTLAESK